MDLRISFWILILVLFLVWGFKLLNWIWLRPKKLENCLRRQGFAGNSYRLFSGDLNDMAAMMRRAKSNPINFSHDIAPRVIPSIHHTIHKYGKNSFMWLGPYPRVHILDPEQVKAAFSLNYDVTKPSFNPIVKFILDGLASHEGTKWAKHRKIINPAFHFEKLKEMETKMYESCNEMIGKWEGMMSREGCCELDVMPHLQTLAADVISRTAFGSSYGEGQIIFQHLKELTKMVIEAISGVYIPGWRFLPTKSNKRMKKMSKEIKAMLLRLIEERQRAMKAGETVQTDLLSTLLKSNFNEIQEHGNNDAVGMSIEDVVEECKIFYFAGQETTAMLLVWSMVLLSSSSKWQDRARAEVLQVFGTNKPDFDGLNHLKVVTMILNEVLRLYPPGGALTRIVQNETRLGNLTLPAGVMLSFPIVLIHRDQELWGEDANEFNPERFGEGVSKATINNKIGFFPFGWGPRVCIGQNFAMMEAKMALSMILQHFSFQLSPSYTHAPASIFTIQPQHGAHIILHKLK